VLTNDPHPPSNVIQGVTVSHYSVIATMCVILPNVKIGSHCLIGAGSILSINAEDNMLYSGNPAKKICQTNKIRLKDGSRGVAYPWIRHFNSGYPDDVIKLWKNEES
jgi:carbonic anhydrase/acetyltransferase-like protein (isoleucine patch superfamily)